MLLIAPMDAGITHSRCTCWHDPGEILLIILWMSYFLYPQLARLPCTGYLDHLFRNWLSEDSCDEFFCF